MTTTTAADGIAGAPLPGSIFADKYRIERVLGVGGMGYVLAAVHVHLDERVAIKMLLPELARSQDLVTRFLREGRAAVKIRSEHVGKILDVGSSEGTPYIVMEYLDGHDLSAVLQQRGPLRIEIAADYVLQACEAIAEAHAMHTVHRDLKPANLFLVKSRDGTDCVKVLDFGISKVTAPEGAAQLSMTKTSAMMGSPLYMSPEQLLSSRDVDARADIWSIGIVLFELVAGRPPFLATSLPELSVLILAGTAPDVRSVAPDAPEGFAAVIETCLRRKADDRFPSVAELAFALAPWGSEKAWGSATQIARTLGKDVPSKRDVTSPPHVARTAVLGPPPGFPIMPNVATGPQQPNASVGGAAAVAQTRGAWGSTTDNEPQRVVQQQERRTSRAWMIAGPAFVMMVLAIGGFAAFGGSKLFHPRSDASSSSTTSSSASSNINANVIASSSAAVSSTVVAEGSSTVDAGGAPPAAASASAHATANVAAQKHVATSPSPSKVPTTPTAAASTASSRPSTEKPAAVTPSTTSKASTPMATTQKD